MAKAQQSDKKRSENSEESRRAAAAGAVFGLGYFGFLMGLEKQSEVERGLSGDIHRQLRTSEIINMGMRHAGQRALSDEWEARYRS